MRWLIPTVALVVCVGCSLKKDACPSAATRCASDTTLEVCGSGSSDTLAPGDLDWHPYGCAAAEQCITGGNGVALCADPSSFDPRCGTALQAKICTGQHAWAECSSGYRVRTGGCYQCIEPTPGQAMCVAEGSYADPLCSGHDGVQCRGNSLVQCSSGYVVAQAVCRACETPSSPGEPGSCRGAYGADCSGSQDCAPGLECHAGSDAGSICTVACTDGTDAGVDAGPPPLPGAICRNPQGDPAGDAGPGPQGVLTGVLPSSCIAGYCQ